MKQNSISRQKIIFVLTLFALFFGSISAAHAQEPQGVALFWDSGVGCQEGENKEKRTIFLEDIVQTDCLRVCSYSTVNYELHFLPVDVVSTTWNVTGGTITSSTNEGCTVIWAGLGFGTISLNIVLPESTITKTLCIEKMELPTAFFEVVGQTETDYFNTCSEQVLNFTNLSNQGNGTMVMPSFWDFGDGNVSTVFSPTHTYAHEGEYTVILKVYNSCNCVDTYKLNVIAKRRGFEIQCPTVVCEGQSAIYSLPFDGAAVCSDHYQWSVSGGQIISESNGSVEVLWDDVDPLGFGTVTFNPDHCDLPCLESSSIKVPVVQSKGTIQGPTELCLNEQGKYNLPQWPTTDIIWQILGNDNNDLADVILTDQRNEVIIRPLASGILTLKAIYTNTLLNCSGEADFRIIVAPPLQIIGEDYFCQNADGIFTNSANAIVNWTLKDASNQIVALDTNTSLDYNFSNAGIYKLEVQSPDFCSASIKTIVVMAKPAAPTGITGEDEICPNTPYPYSVNSPDANFSYEWIVTNGVTVGSASGNEVNIIFNGALPATVKVIAKALNPPFCFSDPFTFPVELKKVEVEIHSDKYEACSSSYATYHAFELGTTNLYSEGDSYTWTISNPALGSITAGQGTNTVDVLWNDVLQTTPVDLILTISKCTLSPLPIFSKTITIYPKPLIKIVADINPICAGNLYAVTYTVESDNNVPFNGNEIVTWNFGNGDINSTIGDLNITKTFNNNGTTSIEATVTAFIADANGCGGTNTASIITTVLPNPPAVATLTSGGNVYCDPDDVDVIISVSSNTVGVTLQWYKDNVAIAGANQNQLIVDSTLNFGNYSFRVVNANGCVNKSNNVSIVQVCGVSEPTDCTMTGTITNTSYLSDCGEITFEGTAIPTPIEEIWKVLGASETDYTITNNILTGVPGLYHIIHKATYPCLEGPTASISSVKQVVIPYEPDFSYIVDCDEANNTFNINFIDNSNFYSPVLNQQVRFYYKAVNDPSFSAQIPYDADLAVFELENLTPGNYIFRIENEGTSYTICSKEYEVNLQGIDTDTKIVFNADEDVECHDSAVPFALSPEPSPGSSVVWDFGGGAINSLLNPKRVFTTADTTYTIMCTIRNEFGCDKTLYKDVYIPKECFFGDIISLPADAKVCKDGLVTLTYQPNNDNCTVSNYKWMNGFTEIIGAANEISITVDAPGSYWVKVTSDNGCTYNSPTKIAPTFMPLPEVKIQGLPRYCENDPIVFTAVTDATTIVWSLDGVDQPQFDGLQVTDWSGYFSPNTFNVTCTVSNESCSNTASHMFTIEEPIQDIDIQIAVNCNPYQVTVTALPVTNSTEPLHYNWSNGVSGWDDITLGPIGNTISLNDGGPFSVTVSAGGGCSFTKQIDVPRSPENYMWIFPTGCFNDCDRKDFYLIGPRLPINYWSWNQDGISNSEGSDFPDPYTLENNGNYTLLLDSGACHLESNPLSFSKDECKDCKLDVPEVVSVEDGASPYCSFVYTMVINSSESQPFQASISDKFANTLIIPSSYTLYPGPNVIQFTVIPQNIFVGGPTVWRINGLIPDHLSYKNCTFEFEADVPHCNQPVYEKPGAVANDTTGTNDFKSCMLYPNPASGSVQLQYDLGVANATVELYELTGRLLTQQTLKTAQGTVGIDISSYSAGMYIVVVRSENKIVYQQKLIIK